MIWQRNNLKQKWNYGLSSLRTVWALVQLLLDLDIEVFSPKRQASNSYRRLIHNTVE